MSLLLQKLNLPHRLSPSALMAFSFMLVILVGTLLLSLPISSAQGQRLPFLTALFTATSATCVTGLTLIDIGTHLSFFGQLVVLIMIQLGGLGITTFGTFLLILTGRRLSVRNEFVLMNAYGVGQVRGIKSLLLWTIGFTLFFEGVGTALLWTRYRELLPVDALDQTGHAPLFYAGFHAVSAFCNAGFSLHSNSLIGFSRDPLYLPVISLLIVIGGLGFLVLYNLVSFKFWRQDLRQKGRISLHSRTVLTITSVLILCGMLLFLLEEWNGTLAQLPLLGKLNCALFHSITPRTAGFNAVPMEAIKESTRFTTALLMLIGGSPGSAAGGLKTTTLVVLVMTLIAMCRNRADTVLFTRTLPFAVVRQAFVMVFVTASFVISAYGILLFTEAPILPGEASRLMFETISAFATVGLSINHTEALSTIGRCVIIFCMFIGRLGPLSIVLIIGNREKGQWIQYPEEEIVVG